MWLSKKKYNEMVDFVNDMNERIKDLEWEQAKLIDCHEAIEGRDDCDRLIRLYSHNNASDKANTKNIKDITLQELASYVIDHKPIERKEKIEVTKKYF